MVAVRITRQGVEVVADANAVAGISRVEAEVATNAQGASTDAVRVSRQAIEVVAKNPPTAAVTRVEAEVATATLGASTDAVGISRQAIEIVAANVPEASITRIEAEVATGTLGASTDPVKVSRQAIEVVARRGSAGPITPLDLADGIEVFLHNWATELTLATTYRTDVRRSPTSGAESRLGLVLKPDRTMKLVWELHDDVDRIDRLLVMLRKLTDERIAIPLYCDQRELAADYTSLDDTVFLDTTVGRWAIGARVVIVQFTGLQQYQTHSFHIIQDIQDDRLVFDAALGVDVAAGSVVMPMMDCEVLLEVEVEAETALHARLALEVQEVPGQSALPPVKADFPVDAQFFEDYPIFDLEPDWADGIRVGRERQGKAYRQGRAQRVYRASTRSNQTHKYSVLGDRAETWRAVEFFDTRRGRLRSFWHVDHEQVWSVSSIDPAGTFVSVSEQGDLADFKAELEGGWVGLWMADGTVYVRDVVTVQQVLTVYRLTLNTALPAGLNAADVVRISRARPTRFREDELVENWKHTGLCQIDIDVIECLDENQYDT